MEWVFFYMVVNNLFLNVIDNRFIYININNKLLFGDQIEVCYFFGLMGNIYGLFFVFDF